MGKIILEFDSVEEQEEAKTALNASAWKAVVWKLDQDLRNTTKYESSVFGKETASLTEMEIAEKYRELIRDVCNNLGLILD